MCDGWALVVVVVIAGGGSHSALRPGMGFVSVDVCSSHIFVV